MNLKSLYLWTLDHPPLHLTALIFIRIPRWLNIDRQCAIGRDPVPVGNKPSHFSFHIWGELHRHLVGDTDIGEGGDSVPTECLHHWPVRVIKSEIEIRVFFQTWFGLNLLYTVILTRCWVQLPFLDLEIVSKVEFDFGSISCLQDVLDGALGGIVGRVVRTDDCASLGARTHSTKAIPGAIQWKMF